MDALKDENVQKLGIVRVGYLLDQQKKTDITEIDHLRRIAKFFEALPFRTAALYIVSKPNVWDGVINASLQLLNPATRVRTRLLSGKQVYEFFYGAIEAKHTYYIAVYFQVRIKNVSTNYFVWEYLLVASPFPKRASWISAIIWNG
jgi:hypothetical protein